LSARPSFLSFRLLTAGLKPDYVRCNGTDSPAVTPAGSPVSAGSSSTDSLAPLPSFSEHKRKLEQATAAAAAAAAVEEKVAPRPGVGLEQQQKKKQRTLMGFFPVKARSTAM
jgi:hypothetical protein